MNKCSQGLKENNISLWMWRGIDERYIITRSRSFPEWRISLVVENKRYQVCPQVLDLSRSSFNPPPFPPPFSFLSHEAITIQIFNQVKEHFPHPLPPPLFSFPDHAELTTYLKSKTISISPPTKNIEKNFHSSVYAFLKKQFLLGALHLMR